MRPTALRLIDSKRPVKATVQAGTSAGIPLARLELYLADWLSDGGDRLLSKETVYNRQFLAEKLMWFLRRRGFDYCDAPEVREFLNYAANGHAEPGGRWGNPRLKDPLAKRTIHSYYGILRTFFEWPVWENEIESSPMARIRVKKNPSPQIKPFTDDHIDGLLDAAARSDYRLRDTAIVLFLLDTGVRATEFCTIRWGDINLDTRECEVLGKGSKPRTVYFGRTTAKALWQYLHELDDLRKEKELRRQEKVPGRLLLTSYSGRRDDELKTVGRDPEDRIFLSYHGTRAGEALTRSGSLQIVTRLGQSAGLKGVRCSPHTARHTFAYNLARAGCSAIVIMLLMGHSDISTSCKYVNMAATDLREQHRLYSGIDRRFRGGRK